MWTLKSTTQTFANALSGSMPNWTTYTVIAGGVYPIKYIPEPDDREVTVHSEGKDLQYQQVKAVEATFKNQSFPAAIISQGDMTLGNTFETQWGPIMAHGNIYLYGRAATMHYPRKFS